MYEWPVLFRYICDEPDGFAVFAFIIGHTYIIDAIEFRAERTNRIVGSGRGPIVATAADITITLTFGIAETCCRKE